MCVRSFVHQKSLEVHQMISDPIVDEIRRYRNEHAEKYGNDLQRIVKAFKEKERSSKHELLNPGPKLLSKKAKN